MYKESPRSIAQIRRFINEKGDEYLAHFEETALENAEWLFSSHGAVIRVAGEYDADFERLFVLVPRPREAPADRFQNWVNERLQGLSWYMEASNTGRCVRKQVTDNAACAIVMRRVGALLGGSNCPVPDAADTYLLLENFVRDVRSYVRNIGDNSLRYVRSLRLYQVPRKGSAHDYVIGLDVMPTLVGLEGESVPIHPLTLVRGTIGEVAELLDGQLHPSSKRSLNRAERRDVKSVVKHLDAICLQIDQERPDLEAVQQLLKATRQHQTDNGGKGTGLWVSAVFALAALAVLWFEFSR